MPFRSILLIPLIGLMLVVGLVTPAQAATINGLRWCSPVHSHPVSVSCTVRDTVPLHHLTVLDATGKQRVLSTGPAVWSWAKRNSVKCKFQDRACYGYDDVTKSKVIYLDSRTALTLGWFR